MVNIMYEGVLSFFTRRRSIRSYTERIVEREKLEILLKSAMAAPTTANNQPWEFIVIDDKDMMNSLRKILFFGPYNATAAIVVCGNMNFAFPEPSRDYWIQDCSAAIENILLAATEMGLGSVWIGLHPLPSKIKPVRKLLDIPDYVIPLSVVYLGYPNESKEPRTQYNEKVVYWQKYDPARKHRARPKNMKHM
jgi:Nitroreductase